MANSFPVKVNIEAVDKVTAKIRSINASISSITAPTRNVLDKVGALRAELGLDNKTVGEAFSNVGQSASRLGGNLTRLGLVGAGALTAVVAGVKAFAHQADDLQDTAQRLGLNVEAFQELRFAATQSGMETADFDNSLKFFNKNIVEAAKGTGDAAKVFKALKIDVKNSDGTIRSFESVLPELADKFKQVRNPSLRAALAMEIFGRSGDKMGVLLGEGSDKIKELRERARSLGLVIDEDQVDSAAELNDKLNALGQRFAIVGGQLASAFVPVFNTVADELFKFFTENKQALDDFAAGVKELALAAVPLIKDGLLSLTEVLKDFTALTPEERVEKLSTAFKVLAFVALAPTIASTVQLGLSIAKLMGTFLGPLATMLLANATVMSYFGMVMTTVQAVMGGFLRLMFTTPWGIAIMALVSAVVLLWQNWDLVVAKVQEFWSWLKQTNIGQALLSALSPVVDLVGKIGGFIFDLFSKTGEVNVNGTMQGGNVAAVGAQAASLGAQQTLDTRLANEGARNETAIKVDFANMPKGTQVSTEKSTGVEMDLGMGFSMVN